MGNMENENFELRRLMDRVGCVLALCIAVLIALSLLSSCTTTKYVEVEKIHNDTTYITKWQRDSIYLKDSTHVSEKGDTVRIEHWHTEWRDRWNRDTIYQATHDTIPAPYPEIEYVEKELSWWQRTQMYAGDVMLVCLLALLGYGIIRLRR